MKILFISDTYFPHLNGVYYFVCRVAPFLQERGHEVTVLAPSESHQPSFKQIDHIDVYGIPSIPIGFYPNLRMAIPFQMRKRIHSLLDSLRPDIIHLQDHFAICEVAMEMARQLKIPVVGTNHFMPENLTALVRSRYLKKAMEKLLWLGFSKVYNQVKVVTTPTEIGALLIRSKLSVPVLAVSSGIDFTQFNQFGDHQHIKSKYAIPEKPVLIFVGRVDPEKRLEETIYAVALALQRIDFCFVIVGKGLRKTALEALVRELGLTKNVIFTGFVPDEDLPLLYKASHAFAISSIAELLSLATLQAMASGLPVVAVNAGALSEIVQDHESGFLYPEGDVAALAGHIETLFTNTDLHARMSQKSIELAWNHDIGKTITNFEKLYQDSAVY